MERTLTSRKYLRQTNDDRDPGRLEAFSDGVIAVAITLLVLDVQVPNVKTGLLQALLNQWPAYLGYVTSFLVIGIFLANHHNIFKIYMSCRSSSTSHQLFLPHVHCFYSLCHRTAYAVYHEPNRSTYGRHHLWRDAPAEWDPV